MEVELEAGPELIVQGDGDQLDQALTNLVRNAADAARETGGGVRSGWRRAGGFVEVWVEDDGPGLANTANLFVPFFTTKPGGSGIGLALCRQGAPQMRRSACVRSQVRPGRRPYGCSASLAAWWGTSGGTPPRAIP